MSVRTDGGVVCFGELLLRLAAPGAQLLMQTVSLDVAWGGAEANVAVSLARLGHDARMVSALPDNALGRAARGELRRHGVDTTGVMLKPGRMGLYFLTPGAGLRPAEIIYDRAHSVFAETDFSQLDWSAHFAGAGWFHVSGVTAALGQASARGAIEAARQARRAGLTVSFDCNYRAKLWDGWGGDAPAILGQLVREADLAFADHRDIGLLLGRRFDGKHHAREAAEAAFAEFPVLARMACTQRVEHSADHHDVSAAMYGRDDAWSAPAISVTRIVDRIGAGDAFAAGVIHALRRQFDDEATVRFGLAASALKHVTPGDASLAREEDVMAVMSGDLGVRR